MSKQYVCWRYDINGNILLCHKHLRQGNICYVCGKKITDKTPITIEDAYVTNFLKERIHTNIKPTFKCLSLSLLGRDGRIVYTMAFDIAKMSVPYPLILCHDVGVVEMFTTLHITNVNYNCFKKEE